MSAGAPRALCLVAVLAGLSGCGSASAQPSERPLEVVAAGDIGDDAPLPNFQDETARLVRRIDPDLVLALGDLAYQGGTLADFQSHYDPWWGRFKAITRPVPGNHEQTDLDRGYDAYFGPGRHNYSFDRGGWHLVGVDTNNGDASALGFLRDDLARTRKRCLLLFLHHPLHSSGRRYSGGVNAVRPLYRAFRARGGDVVLAGHEHNYERFAKQDPGNRRDRNGYRAIVSGAGGQNLRGFRAPTTNSRARIKQPGVLRLLLERSSYRGSFIGADGARDRVPRTACND